MSHYGDDAGVTGRGDEHRRARCASPRRSGHACGSDAVACRALWCSAPRRALVRGRARRRTSYVSLPDAASRHQLAATTGGDTGLVGPARTGLVDRHRRRLHRLQVLRLPHDHRRDLGDARRDPAAARRGGRRPVAARARRRHPAVAGHGRDAGRRSAAAVAVIFAGTTVFTLLAGRNPDVGFGVGDTCVYGLSIAIAAGRVRRGRRAHLTAGPHAARRDGPRHDRVRRRLRRAHDRRLRAEHAVAAVAHPVRLDRADAALHRQQLRARSCSPSWRRRLVLGCGRAARVTARRRRRRARRATSHRCARSGSVALRLAARLELPVLVAWCVGTRRAGLALRHHRQGGDRSGARVDERHARQVRRAGHVPAPVPRRRVPARRRPSSRCLPASQIGAAAEEETSGRLVNLLAQPTRRAAWFAGRLGIARRPQSSSPACSPGSRVARRQSQGVDLGFGTMLGAGAQRRPDRIARARHRRGRAVRSRPGPRAAAVYGVVSVVLRHRPGGVAGASLTRWLEQLSLFHYMALAPAQSTDTRTVAVTVTLAVVLVASADVRLHSARRADPLSMARGAAHGTLQSPGAADP